MRYTAAAAALALVTCLGAAATAETYRHVWTTTADFEGGGFVNTNATDVADQLQLDLSQIETPYLWVANSSSDTVARIDTATGRVLSVTQLPGGRSPSRTAVDIDFNCWVAVRHDNGRLHKLSAVDGSETFTTARVGKTARGVAINAAGDVWVSTSVDDNGQGFGWMKVDAETGQPITTFHNPIGSYGLAIDPLGKVFSTTSWIEARADVQRVDGTTGQVEQRWMLRPAIPEAIYGITVDIEGDVWGAVRFNPLVAWIDGDYNCPDDAANCPVSEGAGLHRIIDVNDVLIAAGSGTGLRSGRGIAVDANGFVWAVFNDRTTSASQSYAVKIDGSTGEPILAVPTGFNSVGITPDADGFIWVVNQRGGGPNVEDLPCPDGFSGNGTVTRLRSSDGSVVGTYPTCGAGPYTYSDMAGYTLRSVTLRSGTWRAVHDSAEDDRAWGRALWTSRELPDTTFRIRARAANAENDLGALPWIELSNGDPLPLQGRYIEVEVFFFTRNDFLGPVLEDLTLEGICERTPEICDGFDNDCNDLVDDGNPGGGARCDTGLDGVCAIGERTCVRGGFECHTLGVPMDEICNEVDDNCDGRVDEGVQNLCGACGEEPEEVCDGEDNDCDGLIDEGTVNACGDCGPAPEEVCDGEDNDCDGLVDEGLLNACGLCGPDLEEVCDGEDNDCDGLTDEGVANACGNCGPTPDEVCDGEDNDCDGLVDEGLINACGECGPAPEEICDGQDNNCNGRVDEGVQNACGFCGPLPEEVCDGADNDCDELVDEGLANACGGCGEPPAEVCNGVDDDCDGEVDEDVQNACGACGIAPQEVCDGQDNDCDGEIDERVRNACGACGELGDDVCDGIDSDCDGEIDEDPECVEGRSCVAGECAEPCAAGECPRGFYCSEGSCLIDRCLGLRCADNQVCDEGACVDQNVVACQGVECPGEQVCLDGQCVDDPCEGVDCPEREACWLGECLPEGEVACREVICDRGAVCEEGVCVDDPCLSVRCGAGEFCVDGACEDACDQVQCNTGFSCNLGICIEDPCFNVECADGQSCVAGNCVYADCIDVECPDGEICGADGCQAEGTCGDAVCQDGEVCRNGACETAGDVDPQPDPGADTEAAATESDCSCELATSPVWHPWRRR
jgi:streptogramin lyase